jgi:hypothetical protein
MATYKIELNNRPIKGSKEHALMLRITVEKVHARMKLIHSVLEIPVKVGSSSNLGMNNEHSIVDMYLNISIINYQFSL